ncbi:MAG: S41 family peptidase [Bacteroidia bacterium]
MKILSTIFLLVIGMSSFGQSTFRKLQPEEMQKELSIIQATFDQIHPGTYRFNSEAQVKDIFKQAKLAASKPMPEDSYMILLSQLTAEIKCGHTYLNYWNQDKTITERLYSKSFLPLLFKIVNDKIIITNHLSGYASIVAGDEIRSINGIKSKEIIRKLLTVSQTDGRNGKSRQINNLNIAPLDISEDNYNLFDIYFPLFFPSAFNGSTYAISIKTFTGKHETLKVKAMTKSERQDAYQAKFGKIPTNEQNWSYSMLDRKTGYLKIGDFETWNWKSDYKKYLDSVFNSLSSSHVENLIIDVRGNGGGDDEARDQVLSYLARRPFGCEDRVRKLYKFLAVPDSLSTYLKTWDKTFKQAKDPAAFKLSSEGLYEKVNQAAIPCDPIKPKANAFIGKQFLLTDASNSSATFRMAQIFQKEDMGLVVGEPTGGSKQGINGGQLFFLRLPFSKLEIDIPLIWGAAVKKQSDEGVKPNVMSRTTQKSIYAGEDAQLNKVLQLINKQ